MKLPRTLTLVILALFVTSSGGAQSAGEWADEILKAVSRNQAIPAIGATSGNGTEFMGYQVQRALVKKRVAAGDEVVGHKAGATSEAAQLKFGLLEPVAGELLKSHLKETATFVSLRQYKGMMIEMEIGFRLKLTIRDEPANVEELKAYVRDVVPVVELPNLHFTETKITPADIIGSNVGATIVIVGNAKPVESLDLNKVKVTLAKNGEEIAAGVGSDAMGDQWEALLWLVRQRLREGYEVKRNDLLITGSLGKVMPAEAGRYVADFGRLGRVTFSMR